MSIAKNCISGLSDTDYRRFARRLMETDRAAYTDILAKDASRYEAIVEKRAGRVVSTVSASEKLEDVGPGPALSSLLEAFHAEGLRQGLVVKTLKGDETDLREFISVAGDKPIRNYVKADAIAFKDVLTRCPANRKSENYRGLTIADCAALAEKNEVLRRLSTSTVNDKLNALSKFFAWADGHLEGVPNPFEGTRIKVKRNRSKRAQDRLPFSTDELQKIFGSIVFTGCVSRSSWKKPGQAILRDSARFWAPLIALFSGLRLGEIIQMRVADIKTDTDGIRYFDISTLLAPDDVEDAKSLKTTTSERQVPVHPFLFRCDLQELIDKRISAGEARLLLDYGPSKSDGSWSKNFSGWFNGQFRPHIGVERIVRGQNRVNFHSFRHNFEDVVRNLPDVKQEVRDALQGHGENGVSAQYGTGVYRKTLNEAIQKVDYEDLDLSHLVLRS
jgi:integrase